MQNVEPIKADLERIGDDDIEIVGMPTGPGCSGFDEMDQFKRFPF